MQREKPVLQRQGRRIIAAQAGFLFDNPAACANADDYERAMRESVEAETAIARLLIGDPEALQQGRAIIARRAGELVRAW